MNIFDWFAVDGGLSLNVLVSDQRGDFFLDLGLGMFLGVQI